MISIRAKLAKIMINLVCRFVGHNEATVGFAIPINKQKQMCVLGSHLNQSPRAMGYSDILNAGSKNPARKSAHSFGTLRN
jgi:hypothetical protein